MQQEAGSRQACPKGAELVGLRCPPSTLCMKMPAERQAHLEVGFSHRVGVLAIGCCGELVNGPGRSTDRRTGCGHCLGGWQVRAGHCTDGTRRCQATHRPASLKSLERSSSWPSPSHPTPDPFTPLDPTPLWRDRVCSDLGNQYLFSWWFFDTGDQDLSSGILSLPPPFTLLETTRQNSSPSPSCGMISDSPWVQPARS